MQKRTTLEEKLELRKRGYTYAQIAETLGISRQAVSQALARYQKSRFQIVTPDGCIYKGLRDWMNYNCVSRSELLRRMGLSTSSANICRIRSYLRGKVDPPKRTIDMILSITGMTYEETFGEVSR